MLKKKSKNYYKKFKIKKIKYKKKPHINQAHSFLNDRPWLKQPDQTRACH